MRHHDLRTALAVEHVSPALAQWFWALVLVGTPLLVWAVVDLVRYERKHQHVFRVPHAFVAPAAPDCHYMTGATMCGKLHDHPIHARENRE